MKKRLRRCAVIVVTYNSEKYMSKLMQGINAQTYPAERIILVDGGSSDPTYLNAYRQQSNVVVVMAEKDCGFCKGNNIGMTHLPELCDYVFFLNPDAFLAANYLEKAIAYMEMPANQECGALTGILLGYDIAKDKPKEAYDSTGVFRRWYGQWYDRDQGQVYQIGKYLFPEVLTAICGAAFFCRKKALDSVRLRGEEVFDNQFYMYKEDIDLSLRLSQQKWKLAFIPDAIAYHCRGWQPNRSNVPRRLRLASVRNELTIQWRLKAPLPIVYSLFKYAAVKVFDM